MNRFKFMSSVICLFLVFPSFAHSADETTAPSSLDWLATKTQLTTEVLIPSLSLSGQESEDVIQRATFHDIKVTAEGGSCRAVFERGKVTFNDFGDGGFLQPPAIESQDVSLRIVSGKDKRGEGRRVYAVEFPEEKYLNQVYVVFSPGPISHDCLLVMKESGTDQLGGVFAPYDSFKHIVPLFSQGQPNRLTAVSRQDTFSGRASNVEMPGSPKRSTIFIGGRIGADGGLTDDMNSVSRNAFGDAEMSTLVAYETQQFVLEERKIKDPTGKERRIVDLVAVKKAVGSAGKAISRQFSLVLDAKSAGADRLLIRTDGRLSNVEAFIDYQREKYLLTRIALVDSAVDLKVVDHAHELVGSGVDFRVQDRQIVSAAIHESGVEPSLLNSLTSLTGLKHLQFTHCRNKSFISDIEFLRQLRNLESLSFYVTPISDPVLAHVGQLPNLKYLRIHDEVAKGVLLDSVPHVTDAGLRHLTGLNELNNLWLYGRGVSDEGLQTLSSLPKLSEIHLYKTRVSLRGVVQFKIKMPEVRLAAHIQEPQNDKSTEDRVITVEFDSTRHHAVLEGDYVGDAEIRELVRVTDLRDLRISGSNEVSDQGISELSNLPNLETLSLAHLKKLSNHGVSEIAKHQNLKELSLWYCEEVDNKSIPDLAKLTSLSKLNVHGTKISHDGRKRLQALLPNCIVEE